MSEQEPGLEQLFGNFSDTTKSPESTERDWMDAEHDETDGTKRNYTPEDLQRMQEMLADSSSLRREGEPELTDELAVRFMDQWTKGRKWTWRHAIRVGVGNVCNPNNFKDNDTMALSNWLIRKANEDRKKATSSEIQVARKRIEDSIKPGDPELTDERLLHIMDRRDSSEKEPPTGDEAILAKRLVESYTSQLTPGDYETKKNEE